jgi:hypothetical protein
MIQISDKVICVNDAYQDDDLARIKNGEIYVVREIVEDDTGVGLRLVGKHPEQTYYRGQMVERAWNILRFRKLADIQSENAARHAESALENALDQT